MRNKIMEYSSKTISLALLQQISYIGKNDFERFLIQQNIIQYLLMALVLIRTSFPDKNFRGWIENATLGNLIHLYKICAAENEKSLMKWLKEYNGRRVYLVHKIVKNANYKQMKIKVYEANGIGEEIMKYLEKLVIKEYEAKLGEEK